MTHNLETEAQQEFEEAAEAGSAHAGSSEPATSRLTKDKISLEAVINVLLERGVCTEEQLLAEEARLQTVRRTLAGLNFRPVRIVDRHPAHHENHHALRRWASRRRWSRRLGTLLFGWKWKKHKKETT